MTQSPAVRRSRRRRALTTAVLTGLAAVASFAALTPATAGAGPPLPAPCVVVPVVFSNVPVCPVNAALSVVRPCDDGWDNDGDGTADYNGATGFPADPGCTAADDPSEHGTTVCDNGVDDDGDGYVDVDQDPGCESPTDSSEHWDRECDDGIDNDGDGRTDWPRDAGCLSIAWPSED